jgi:dinuclear metal center YbgI/SA1388 family protein
MTTIRDLVNHLESIAPPSYQEDYDNAGLIVGNPNTPVKGVLTCLDSTEAVLEEALETGCNVVVAHHPIVFRGLKRFTGRNYVERVVLKAIKQDVAIYAIHTNLDNMYAQGVNAKITERLGLINTRILAPKSVLKRIDVFTDLTDSLKGFLEKMNLENLRVVPHKLEITYASALERELLQAIQQHAPSANFEIWPLETPSSSIGAGMIGELPTPVTPQAFLSHLKTAMLVNTIKHTPLLNQEVGKIAVCGGAGGFLLPQAIAQGADFFVTADYKYHEFFDADGRIVIADIGHYESEQFTVQLLQEIISQKFSKFAVCCSKVNTNPIGYF